MNLKKLKSLAILISKHLKIGTTIALEGDLGAGKTTFTCYLVKALGIKERASSPTFNIINEYTSKEFSVIHIDAYRLNEYMELELDSLLKNSILIIEWPRNLKFIIEDINIKFKYLDQNTRDIEIIFNEYYSKIYNNLKSFKESK